MRTIHHLGRLSSLLAVASLLAGCSYVFPNHRSLVADRWGDAHENNVAKMTANATAGQVGEPIALDPQTGELIGASYYELQDRQPANKGTPSIIQIEAN